jgi:hypothetical protein
MMDKIKSEYAVALEKLSISMRHAAVTAEEFSESLKFAAMVFKNPDNKDSANNPEITAK